MKSRVDYSTFSAVASIALILVLAVAVYFNSGHPVILYSLLGVLAILCFSSLWYAPLSISADDSEINIHSSMKIRSIPMDDVAIVERYKPGKGSIRLYGSGGFMGYWGLFRDSTIGNYRAYYGSKDNCFLIVTKSGNKYLLGCAEPDEMVRYISSRINR